MQRIMNLLVALGYFKEISCEYYCQYVNQDNRNIFLFKTEMGISIVNFSERTIFTEYEFLKHYNVANEIYTQIAQPNSQHTELVLISYVDLFLQVNLLKPQKDKLNIFTDSLNRDCLLLFRDAELKGYAYQYGSSTFYNTKDQKACWSGQKSKLNPKEKITLTTSMIEITSQEQTCHNYILTQPNYFAVAHCIDKVSYKNIRFCELTTWFLGSIHYINMNTPLHIGVETSDKLYQINAQEIKCLKQHKEYKASHMATYIFEPTTKIVEAIINELNENFNLPIVPFKQ